VKGNDGVDVCEPLRNPRFLHALEHAWTFARLRCGDDSTESDRWVHQIAEDLRAGKVQDLIAALKRLRPKTEELRASLQSLIGYYSENAGACAMTSICAWDMALVAALWRAPKSKWSTPVCGKPECAGARPGRGVFSRCVCWC
jgi:hypothetical protein